jgi:hypothetical protein
MGKKIQNPLREGLSSKIYLLAYETPLTGYELAKRIYGVEKSPITSKIYPKLKELKKLNHIIEERDINRSNPDSLLAEIIISLKQEEISELTNLEQYALKQVISSSIFRSFVGSIIQKQEIPKGDIDAIQFIVSKLSAVAAMGYLTKKYTDEKLRLEPTIIQQFDKYYLQMLHEAVKIQENDAIGLRIDSKTTIEGRFQGLSLSVNETVDSVVKLPLLQLNKLMESLPTSLLEKLINLDDMASMYVVLAERFGIGKMEISKREGSS